MRVFSACKIAILVWLGLLLVPRATSAQSCSQTLSAGANLASAIASAAAGSTICLNSGNYGTVDLGTFTKNPRVTVRAVTRLGASLRLEANNGANGVIFDGLAFGDSGISGSTTKNITIQNSSFGTNQLDISTINFNNNNILIDRNTFGAHNASSCEGRLCVHWGNGPGSTPAGVVITNNTFGPGGCSDGVQTGSNGVVVGPGNSFTGIVQGSCSQHVDAIQAYGSAKTVINGNYFVDNTIHIGMYDGGSNETITNNVFVRGNGRPLQVNSVGMVLRHNTFFNTDEFSLGAKPGETPSTNWTVSDNIWVNAQLGYFGGQAVCVNCSYSNNLIDAQSSVVNSTNTISGSPTFVGGSNPTTWAGFQLAAGSLGKNRATDGSDVGSTLFGSPTTPPPPPPPPAPVAPTNVRIVR